LKWGLFAWYYTVFFAENTMPNKFSKVLVKRITKHFAEQHNTTITEEQAQEYLDSLADFFVIVTSETGEADYRSFSVSPDEPPDKP
jgi:hypothetical protein